MIGYLAVFGLMWIGALAWFSLRSFQKNKTSNDYIFAGSNLGTTIGLLTFAATLFSTFTMMGMPDFFRVHGVGAWIFLGISNVSAFFFIIWYGQHLRRAGGQRGYCGLAGLLKDCYETPWAGYVYFAGAFVFLIPYTAIQIRGIAIFLSAVFPEAMPPWGWSVGIVCLILIYSEIGGLRAIVYSDAMQAVILLVALWIVGFFCLAKVGGVEALMEQVKAQEPALLSVPGPKGHFTVQFLVASLFAITMIPVTQPQVATRLMIMKSTAKMHRMAVALGVFSFLVLVPTIAIGLYGAVRYSEASTREFLSHALLFDQLKPVAALIVIGLLAAAISTADSQIFALGTELRSLLRGKERRVMLITRLAIVGFGLGALIFSLVSSDQLVLLARVSFTGTALMGPMVIGAVFDGIHTHRSLIAITGGALGLFLLSLTGVIPNNYYGMRLDLLLAGTVALYAIFSCVAMGRVKS